MGVIRVNFLPVCADQKRAVGTAGHFYVDMTSPAETLVISRDEYTDVVYPWVSPQ
jgi:hypothetical protein